MAAGLGFKTFTTGEVLTAADTNGYLMQGVLVFASAAARDAAITSPQEGQCCYLKDTDAVLTYSGSAWVGFDDSNAVQNSIVDAKGDLIAASAADTPARLAVGANGETLVADSAATTGLRWQGTPSASNPIINAAMQVWQRGTSIAMTTSSYTADRWQGYRAVSGGTISRQVTGDTTNLPNIQYCARVQRNVSTFDTANLYIAQTLESVNSIPFAGKTITFSFYARKGANYSQASSQIPFALYGAATTDANVLTSMSGTLITSVNATLTTTWQRFSGTATVSASYTQIGMYADFVPVGTAGAADYWEVTGVQIDIGSVALPFRTYAATIQGEYAACRRYYRRTSANGTNQYSVVAQGSASNTTNGAMMVPFDVSMRIAPTVVDYSTLRLADGVGAWTITAVAIDTNLISADYGFINCTVASGLTQYRPLFIQSNASASAYLGFSAEL